MDNSLCLHGNKKLCLFDAAVPGVSVSPASSVRAHPPRRPSAAVTAEGPQGGAGSATILDPPTPQSGHFIIEKKTLEPARRGGRIYSRALMGLALPGRYYFITLTSSPESPPIKKSWLPLQKWLKRNRPRSPHLQVFTNEGHGVIHLIIRISKKEKRIEVKEFRKYWQKLHNATQIRFEYVKEPQKLAEYFIKQGQKKKMAGEMSGQRAIIGWSWSKGWLPRGFTKAFGRVWYRLRDAPPGVRRKLVYEWLMTCFDDDLQVMAPPIVKRFGFLTGPG